MKYIGGVLRKISLNNVAVSRSYGITPILLKNTTTSIYDLESDIVKLRNRIKTEIDYITTLANSYYGKRLHDLSADEIASILYSDDFRNYRNIYSVSLNKFVSAIEIVSILYNYLDSNLPKVNQSTNLQKYILSFDYNNDIENLSTVLHNFLLKYYTTATVTDYVRTNEILYSSSLLKFEQFRSNVSYLTQLENTRLASTNFQLNSLYSLDNYNKYSERQVEISKTHKQDEIETLYSKKYDDVDYRKEIFGLRNYHLFGYVDRDIVNSFIVTVDSWLQKIKVFKFSSNNDWILDEKLSNNFTQKFYGKYIYDSDSVILFHYFQDYGILIATEEKGYSVEEYSEIDITFENDTVSNITICSQVVSKRKLELTLTNKTRKNVKLLVFDKDSFNIISKVYLNDIVSDVYPHIIPYVINTDDKLVIVNLAPSRDRVNILVFDLKLLKIEKVYSISLEKDKYSSIYIVPFENREVLFVELDRDVIKELLSNFNQLLENISLESWERADDYNQRIQTIFPEPLYYSTSLKSIKPIQNRFMQSILPISYDKSKFEVELMKTANISKKYNIFSNKHKNTIDGVSENLKSYYSYSSIDVSQIIDEISTEYKAFSDKYYFSLSTSSVSITDNAYVVRKSKLFTKDKNINSRSNYFIFSTTLQPGINVERNSASIKSLRSSIDMGNYNIVNALSPDIYISDTLIYNTIALYTNKLSTEVNRKIVYGRTAIPGAINKITLLDIVSGSRSNKQINLDYTTTVLQDINELIDIISSYTVVDYISSRTNYIYSKSTSNLAYYLNTFVFTDNFYSYTLPLQIRLSESRQTINSINNEYNSIIHNPVDSINVYENYIKLFSNVVINMYTDIPSDVNYLLQDLSSIVNSPNILNYFSNDYELYIPLIKLYIPAHSHFPENNSNEIQINRYYDDSLLVDSIENINIQEEQTEVLTSSLLIREKIVFSNV
ncbi:MAG: hypothetical protein QW806_10165 [Nitrososphaerota archaeon]